MVSLVCLMVFSVLIFTLGLTDTTFQYIIILFSLPTIFIFGLIKEKTQSVSFKLNQWIDILPALIFIVWLYGLILGLFNNNEPENVLRNFFGMSLYIVYYVFVIFSVSKKALFKTIFLSSVINIFYSLIYFISYWFLDGLSNQNIDYQGGMSAIYRSYYSIGLLIHLPLISLILLYIFSDKKTCTLPFLKRRFTQITLLILLVFSLVVTTASKGFFLALVVLGFLLSLILSLRAVFSIKSHSGAVLFLITLLISIPVIISSTDLGDSISYSFSSSESSNSVRNIQREKILDEISVFGSGLGATLKSGYKRDDSGYGFEVTYENLFHKLGVLSLVVMFIFILTCWMSSINIFKGKSLEYSVLSLGLMMYLIPSAGNPMLFSPIGVLMHCMAMYFLRPGNINDTTEKKFYSNV
ncbi:hypothetical protein ACXQF3_003713 [Vibrio fluvialis]|uniref:hypothetical protein n=1 Tax=Vibrio fluvialis TaxID=676 RepID=UPI001C9BDFBF|nr:hypothetical protein [Vibrio fluvialis]ELD1800057.1 hypothetical protein [Vibrio fluvialis]MBY7937194.1 hypothetical protein [Vibrio fluvialis]MCE7583139.1 hypothetical protein [Vibrio fluvialis]UPO64987.1 O-antigen polymerase [Vibrio fluvialis]